MDDRKELFDLLSSPRSTKDFVDESCSALLSLIGSSPSPAVSVELARCLVFILKNVSF